MNHITLWIMNTPSNTLSPAITFELDPNTSEGIMITNGSRDHLNNLYASNVWPSILFLSLVMLTGSVGNLLVCAVYRFDFSKVNNRFILALTGIDLINCLTSIPGELADLRYNYSFGDSPYCPAMRFFQTFCSLGSAGILVAISVDRFKKICKPFDKQTTLQTSAAAVFVCVILSLLCASPAAAINGRKTGLVNGVWTADCSIADAFVWKSSAQIYNGFLFFLFICGCLILIVLYSLIWKSLRKQKRYRMRVAHAPASTTSTSLARNQNSYASREERRTASSREGAVYKAYTRKEIVQRNIFENETRALPIGTMNDFSVNASKFIRDQAGNCNCKSAINQKDGSSNRIKANALMSKNDDVSVNADNETENSETKSSDENGFLASNDEKWNGSSESGSSTSTGKILTSKRLHISGNAEKKNVTRKNGGDNALASNDAKEDHQSTSGSSAVTESRSNVVKSASTRSVEKTTIMMFMVTIVFILSFLPSLCLATAQAVDRKSFKNLTNVQHTFHNLFLRSHFLNSALNPFIYSFFSLQFREQLRVFRRSLMRTVGLG